MRLIDVEELIITILTNDLCGDDNVDKAILNAPTVEAIPIEWIKGYITPFQEFHDCLSEELKENDGAGWVVDVLETMLREWKKENEHNKENDSQTD